MPLPFLTSTDDSADPLLVASVTALRLYARLPEYVRDADTIQDPGGPNGRPLLRFLASVADQAGEVENLLRRIDPVTSNGRSDLVSATMSDAEWLPWLAELVGIANPTLLTTAALRVAITNASTRHRHAGTLASILDAARPALTGTQSIGVVRRYGATFGLRLTTMDTETPSIDAVTAAIDAAATIPAGHGLVVSSYDNETQRALAAGVTTPWSSAYFASPQPQNLLSVALDAAAVVEERLYSGAGWRPRNPRAGALIYLANAYR
jgi:hypothetical protein